MNQPNLSTFLANLSKRRKIPIGELAVQCDISRTTLYRYATGQIQVPPAIEATLAKILSMTNAEREEFRRLISLTVQDGSLISSRYVMDSLVFQNGPPVKNTKEIQFVYHDKDRYLRNSKEIADIILKYSNQEQYRCAVKVLDCIDEEYQSDLHALLTRLLSASDAVEVEHLLAFPKKDYLTCTKTFLAIVPLLSFSNYQVYYNDDPATSKSPFFNDILLVETSWEEGGEEKRQFFVITYLPQGLSQCAAFDDEHMYRFFMENYHSHHANYIHALTMSTPDATTYEAILRLETETEHCLLKSNVCYNKIPLEIYLSVYERMSEEVKKAMGIDVPEGFESYRQMLDTRNRNAYKKGNIDIYTKPGLISFAETGLLSDHMAGLPPFAPEERKQILTILRDRIAKKGGGYQLYITEKDIPLILAAFSSKGMLIEFTDNKDNQPSTKLFAVFIENKMIAEVVFDYANNHIPAYHALPDNEALRFMDGLIAGLG